MQRFSASWKLLRRASDIFGVWGFLVWGAGVVATLIASFIKWSGLQDASLGIQIIYVIAIIVLIGFVLWVVFSLLRSLKPRVDKNTIASTLKIGGQVESIQRINQADVILGGGKAEGNIKIWVKAIFNPVEASLPITRFALEVFGVEVETEFPPKVVSKGSSWGGFFEIPEALDVNNIHARLFAYVGDTRYYSSEFPIPFERIAEGES